jgi:hypothetical protein
LAIFEEKVPHILPLCMKNPSKEPADICIKALDRFLDKKLILLNPRLCPRVPGAFKKMLQLCKYIPIKIQF